MKILPIVFLITFLPFASLSAQKIAAIDSLFQNILSDPDSFSILDINAPLSDYAGRDKDTTLYYADEIIRISKEINWNKGLALGFNIRGLAYELSGDFENGLENYFKAVEIAEQLSWSKQTLVIILNNISIAYSYMGEMDKSMEYLLKTIEINEEEQDSVRLAIAYNNLGSRYLDMSSPDIALLQYQKALNLNRELNNDARIAMNLGNIGVSYHLLKNYDSAKLYLNKSIQMNRVLERWNTLQMNYQQFANVFYDEEELDSSMYYNDLAMALDSITNDGFSQMISEKIKGSILIKMEEYNQALVLLEKSKKAAEAIDYKMEMASIYEQLGYAYKGIQDFENAHRYHWLTFQYMDSLLVKQKEEALSKLARHQEEKNEREKDLLKKDTEIEKLNVKRQETISWAAGISGVLLLFLLGGLFHRYSYVQKTKTIIEQEKQKSDDLLLNILPSETAKELKEKGKADARLYDMVTILFTDFKGFTQLASKLSPSDLVKEIDYCYQRFDEITSKHKIEKIKTIGDAYMAAGGLPVSNKTHAMDVINAAIEIKEFMASVKAERSMKNQPFFEIRIGVHSGPVVAGIVGIKKFAYDIWGDTVNIASRMESNSEAGKINISQTTYDEVKEKFHCQSRGKISAKGKGDLNMYFVESIINNA